MRSSSRGAWLSVLACCLAAWLIGNERARLAESFKQVRSKSDAYLLPQPGQTYIASLGYRSALADLIFGHVLVSYGLHFQDQHLFEFVGEYLDVVNRLDPKFRDPYRFADTLLTMQPVEPPVGSYRKAREILERGTRELPNDQELWSTTGQFLAYLAPKHLPDEAERQSYREAGARALMRACDLVGSNDAIPYHCITAANLLNQQGDREAVRRFLERVMTVTDDPKIQQLASGYLKRVMGDKAQEQVKARQDAFKQKWQQDLPFAPRIEIDALGPPFDAATCAGTARDGADCVTSWSDWAAGLDSTGSP